MNEVTRRVTEEILVRANEAIGRGEARGPKLDQCWKRFEKLNGGIVGPKSWEQIKKIFTLAQTGISNMTKTLPSSARSKVHVGIVDPVT